MNSSLGENESENQRFLSHHDDDLSSTEKFSLRYDTNKVPSGARLWMLASATHGLAFIAGLTIFTLFPLVNNCIQSVMNQRQIDRYPTMWTPIKHAVRYVTNTPPFEYWDNDLYSGPPSYQSDFAWNEILHPHGFSITPIEAEKLNITESIMLPEGNYATILGVIHNLHCLRRLRQTIYSDYYYPNQTATQKVHNDEHTQHCMESLRTSLMCHPDLTLYPYYWSGIPEHDLNPRADVRRECVDWESLVPIMHARQYPYSDLDKTTGWLPGMGPELGDEKLSVYKS